jgi:hypothetical protein
MTEILLCENICPLVIGRANKIIREGDCVSFEKAILSEDKTPIGIVGASVRLNPKCATATFTGLKVDEDSPACNGSIRIYRRVCERDSRGTRLSSSHKCSHLDPKISGYCVTSFEL